MIDTEDILDLARLIEFANKVFDWLRTTPQLQYLCNSNLGIVYDAQVIEKEGDSGIMGVNVMHQISINPINIWNVANVATNILIEDLKNDGKELDSDFYSFVFNMKLKNQTIHTIIHETFHSMLPTSNGGYGRMEGYITYIENAVEYNTNIFIINYKETLETLFDTSLPEYNYKAKTQARFLKENKYMRLLQPNYYSIAFNVFSVFIDDINKIRELILADNIYVNLYSSVTEKWLDGTVLKLNGVFDFAEIQDVSNTIKTIAIKTIRIGVNNTNGIYDAYMDMMIDGDSALIKPYRYTKPYRRYLGEGGHAVYGYK